jgi:hypothetical protein
MPKNPNDYQDYKKYYLARETSPEGLKKRRAREKARNDAIKEGRLSGKNDPREIDHKKPLSKGGGNHAKNTRVTTPTANRKKYDK